jgi:serine/threonine protein kinase
MVGGDDHQRVKLGDFGLGASLLASSELCDACGTPPFMSPEMLGHKYDEKTDVWSFGVVAYALLFGEFPYMPSRNTRAFFKRATVIGHPPTFVAKYHNTTTWPEDNAKFRTDNAIRFVKILLERDPELRPSALESLSTIYMHQVGTNYHAHGVELPSLRPALFSANQIGAFGKCSFGDADVNSLLAQPEKDGQPVLVTMPAESPSLSPIESGAEKQAAQKVNSDFAVARTLDDMECLSDHSTFCPIGDNDTPRSFDFESPRSPLHSNVGHMPHTDTLISTPFVQQNSDQSQTRAVNFLLPSTLRTPTSPSDPGVFSQVYAFFVGDQ